MSRIVVGVDGSGVSKDALRWAVGEARLRGTDLVVVHAWGIPLAGEFEMVPVPPELPGELEQAAKDNLASMVEEALGHGGQASVNVSKKVLEGDPAEVLIKESEGADLLVVGSRGLGGFRDLLLGSVSQQCSHHAKCPVVILRGD
jgi:nucleotide-binding universal stress UspA family protein